MSMFWRVRVWAYWDHMSIRLLEYEQQTLTTSQLKQKRE